MQVKVNWVQRNFRGEELTRRETILKGDSEKEPTRNYVGRLIARHHPELISVDKVHLIDSFEEEFRWYVRSARIDNNCWETAYADPIDDLSSNPPT